MKELKVIFCAEVAEALAVCNAMVFTRELGFSRVEVKSNNFSIISKLCKPKRDISSLGLILEDCLKIDSFFQSCSFCHVFREGNMVARSLVELSLAPDSYTLYWIEEVLGGIYPLVHNDLKD